MVVKARQQGNALVVTIPKAFNVEAGTSFTPRLQEDGIFFERVETVPRLIDEYDDLLLTDLIQEGYTDGKEILKEMSKRKTLMENRLNELMNESASEMTEEDFKREFNL